MNIIIGLGLLIMGGLSAGSSYVPMKGVKGWAWESLWAVQGIVAWVLLPLLLALLATPHLWEVLHSVSFSTLSSTWALGFLWGLGGLAWGMAVRYIGLALGFSIATGFLSSLGTLVPIIVAGRMHEMVSTVPGRVTLVSVGISLLGIVICGRAGMMRDRETGSVREGNFARGVVIALVAGVLAACFAFGIAAGEPIKQAAIAAGATPMWASSPVFFVELLGGVTINLLYCLVMNQRNRSFGDYKLVGGNYLYSALVGTLWYAQFIFYGLAAFFMGPYSYANWSIHMSFMVVASNLWGYYYKEWKGASAATVRWNNAGIGVLVVAGILMGLAGYLL
jgi:L-rhamnose-H+ transport protein